MFEYFISKMNFSVFQSGFLPGDSYTSQLLRVVFLDISQEVWRKGLVYKLKSYGISGMFLNLLKITQLIVSKG